MSDGAAPVELGIDGIGPATRVGKGGFGVVYRAHQEAFGRAVAVKVLSVPALDEDTRRRFEAECRAVGALSGHPHVVAVYGSGLTHTGQPYLVMDYLGGGTMAERVAQRGPLPWAEVAEVGVKLAGALASAHAAGVLHRDIKPENVLISSYGEPQLTDFGVARIQGGTETRSGVITGSLAHAAPEVLNGRPATPSSDVYSLASTLYALAAGHAPFVRPGDENFYPLLTRVATEDPPDLRVRGVPEPLWLVLASALAKDPVRRTPTAVALGEALQAAQRAAGVGATPLVAPGAPAPGAPGPGPPPRHSTPDASTERRHRARLGAVPLSPVTDSTTQHRERPWGAMAPPAPAPPAPRRPWELAGRPGFVALAAALAVLLVAGVVALAQVGRDRGEPRRAASGVPATATTGSPSTAVATSAPAPTVTATAVAGTGRTGGSVPVVGSVPPVTSPAPAATDAPAPDPGGSPPPCAAPFFRAAVTTDKPAYRGGETMHATARYENTSGRACSYPNATAVSVVLNAAGQPVTPAQTFVSPNPGVPFAPGQAQQFSATWSVASCTTDPICFPGRYTVTFDVTPFGKASATFDVLPP